jgi:hypothetical protein
MRSAVVLDAVCVGVQMESGLVGELLTDVKRWLGRPVGVLLPGLEDRALARAGGESLTQMRFAIGLDPVLHRVPLGPLPVMELLAASRKSLIRFLVGDLWIELEGRVFGRGGEELFKVMRFAGAFNTTFDGVEGESCLVRELLVDARSLRHLVTVVGVSGLGKAVSQGTKGDDA